MGQLLLLITLMAPGAFCGNGRIDHVSPVFDTGACPPCPVCLPEREPCPPCLCSAVPRPGPAPERCDGRSLGGETCASLGYAGGRLACLPDCSGFDFSRCQICRSGRGMRCLPPAEVSLAPRRPLTHLTGAARGDEARLAWLEHDGAQAQVVTAALSARGRSSRPRRLEPSMLPDGPNSVDLVSTDDGWLLAIGGRGPAFTTQIVVLPHAGEPRAAGRFDGVQVPLLVPMGEGRWLLAAHMPERTPRIHWVGPDGMPAPAPDAAWGVRFETPTVAASLRDGVLALAWRTGQPDGSTWWWAHHVEWAPGQSAWWAQQGMTLPLPHGRLLTLDGDGATEIAPDGTVRTERDPRPAMGAVFRGAAEPVILRFADHHLFATLWSGRGDRPPRLYVARAPLDRPPPR